MIAAEIVEQQIFLQSQQFKFKKFKCGQDSLVAMYKPQGFKDLPSSVLFGFCEWSGQVEDFRTCLEQAKEWARALGVSTLVGPINYSTIFDYRLRTNDFLSQPFLGEPKNHEAMLRLFEKEGFLPLENYESKEIILGQKISQVLTEMNQLSTSFRLNLEYSCVHVTKDELLQMLPDFFNLTHEIFKDNFAYQEITYDLFVKYFYSELLNSICFDTSFYLKNNQNKIVGYCVNYFDANDPQHLLIKTAGIIPTERKMGISFVYLLEAVLTAARSKYARATFCLMRKGNFPDFLTAVATTKVKTYSLFQSKL